MPVSEGTRYITGGNHEKENSPDLPWVSQQPALHPRPFAKLVTGPVTRVGINQVHSSVGLDHSPPVRLP